MSMFFNFLEFEIGHFFYISQLWQRFEFYEVLLLLFVECCGVLSDKALIKMSMIYCRYILYEAVNCYMF